MSFIQLANIDGQLESNGKTIGGSTEVINVINPPGIFETFAQSTPTNCTFDPEVYSACSDNGQYIIAAARGTDKSIMLSTNFGETWNIGNTTNSELNSLRVTRVAINSSGQYMFVTGEDISTSDIKHFKTSNYGGSWDKITDELVNNVQLNVLAISPDGNQFVAYNNQNTNKYFSNDAGSTWTSVAMSGMTIGGEWQNVQILPNGTTYYASKSLYSGLWKSTDSGVTWQNIYNSPSYLFWRNISVSANGQYIIAACNANNVLVQSSDYGSTWSIFNTGSDTNPFKCSLSSDGRIRVVCGYGFNVKISYNYGSTWKNINVSGSSGWGFNCMLNSNGDYLILSFEYSGIAYSTINPEISFPTSNCIINVETSLDQIYLPSTSTIGQQITFINSVGSNFTINVNDGQNINSTTSVSSAIQWEQIIINTVSSTQFVASRLTL